MHRWDRLFIGVWSKIVVECTYTQIQIAAVSRQIDAVQLIKADLAQFGVCAGLLLSTTLI